MRSSHYGDRLKTLYQLEVLGAAGAQFYRTCLVSKDQRRKFAAVRQLEHGNRLLISSCMIKWGYPAPHLTLPWRLLGFFFALCAYPLPWKLKMKGQRRLVRKGMKLMENLLSTNGNDFDEFGEMAAFREMLLAHEACFAVWYDREMDGWGPQAIEPVETFIKERDRVLLSMDINSFDVKRALPTIPRGLSIQTTTMGEN